MKKNFRSVSMLTCTALLAGALTGCGGAREATSATSDTAELTSPSPSIVGHSYETEAACEAVCEAPDAAPADGMANSVTSWFASGSSKTADQAAYCYDDSQWVIPEVNTESYEKPEENGFYLSKSQPLSTFAADVDTASYANIRRMIENGYGPEEIAYEAVRPEEFLNYFSYDLKNPRKGEKFGVTTELSGCPWNDGHDLLFVGVKAEDVMHGEIPDSNLVFLIDVSGSMASQNKLPLLQDAFTDLVDNLPGEGTVSIVTYSSYEEVVLDGEDMSHKRAIKKAINSLSAGGCTNGERGMEMAYEVAMDHFIEGGNNRVIMATDGDLNVGISDPDELEKFIEKKKESGIFLSVLGFGDGNYKDDRLERLADCGNGNYSYIDSKTEAHKVLVDDMSSTLVTVAKDVKFQVEFNPATVNAYRLIGYENRQMDAVDFNDDTKDGGEIGSGHTVVALYEIIPADSESAIDLKYQSVEKDSSSGEYATIKIRYKEPDENESKLLTFVADESDYNVRPSENLAFAELVSEFAMLIGDSDYAGNITYKDILAGYRKLDNTDDYKDEFYNLVRMVEKRS